MADSARLPGTYIARQLLTDAANGAWYGVAMSERSALALSTTTYEVVDGGYHIKGAKTFCSGAGHADAYLVAARSVGSVVSQFLVPAGSDGLQVEQTWDSLGHVAPPPRTTCTST